MLTHKRASDNKHVLFATALCSIQKNSGSKANEHFRSTLTKNALGGKKQNEYLTRNCTQIIQIKMAFGVG